ncbi:MAG: leucine-rich repeat domain-containing protein [Bacteroidales bacterium]
MKGLILTTCFLLLCLLAKIELSAKPVSIFCGSICDWVPENIHYALDEIETDSITELSLYLFPNTTVSEIQSLARFNNVTKLHIVRCDLSVLPKELFYSFNQIEELYIVNSNVKIVTDEISVLQNLKKISISFCSRIDYNSIIKNLSLIASLKYLYLDNNDIKKIPKSVRLLNQVEFIDLGNNRISRIPKYVFHMQNLKFLMLYDNRIKRLSSYSNGMFIDLTNNPVKQSP